VTRLVATLEHSSDRLLYLEDLVVYNALENAILEAKAAERASTILSRASAEGEGNLFPPTGSTSGPATPPPPPPPRVPRPTASSGPAQGDLPRLVSAGDFERRFAEALRDQGKLLGFFSPVSGAPGGLHATYSGVQGAEIKTATTTPYPHPPPSRSQDLPQKLSHLLATAKRSLRFAARDTSYEVSREPISVAPSRGGIELHASDKLHAAWLTEHAEVAEQTAQRLRREALHHQVLAARKDASTGLARELALDDAAGMINYHRVVGRLRDEYLDPAGITARNRVESRIHGAQRESNLSRRARENHEAVERAHTRLESLLGLEDLNRNFLEQCRPKDARRFFAPPAPRSPGPKSGDPRLLGSPGPRTARGAGRASPLVTPPSARMANKKYEAFHAQLSGSRDKWRARIRDLELK